MSIKIIFIKITALTCIAGVVVVANLPVITAHEAHIINTTATVIDDSVFISPQGGKICSGDKFDISLKTTLADAVIYYTIDGTTPKCRENGSVYAAPFGIASTSIVKAVSCHNGKQSALTSRIFNVSSDYCYSSLKINKVYPNPDKSHMDGVYEYGNEWVELYNPSGSAINVKGWKICESGGCDPLSKNDLLIPAKSYAVVTCKMSTWDHWNIPGEVIKINVPGAMGKGLMNIADMVSLQDAAGTIIDTVNWGVPDAGWSNHNLQVWNPGIPITEEGKVLGRKNNGYDTDKISDWKIFSLPKIMMTYPNGGESLIVGKTHTIRWSANNNNDSGNALSIDIYYSNDSGKTWANVAKNTENDGIYDWRVPLVLQAADGLQYVVPSDKARIKVIATDYIQNFMLSNFDISDNDFRSPVDRSILTPEESLLLTTISMNSVIPVMEGNSSGEGSSNSETNTKSNAMLNKEEDDMSENGQNNDNNPDKDAEKKLQAKPENAPLDALSQNDTKDKDNKSDQNPQLPKDKKDQENSLPDGKTDSPSISGRGEDQDDAIGDQNNTSIEDASDIASASISQSAEASNNSQSALPITPDKENTAIEFNLNV